jgi:hypothetical protein
MNTKTKLGIATALAVLGIGAGGFREIPAPDQFVRHGRIFVQQFNLGMESYENEYPPGPRKSGVTYDRWLSLTVKLRAPENELEANPEDVIITTSREPIIVKTNGFWQVSFK